MGFRRTDYFRDIWLLPAFTGREKTPHVLILEYSHAWVESSSHYRPAGRPPYMKVFVLAGTQTHAVRD